MVRVAAQTSKLKKLGRMIEEGKGQVVGGMMTVAAWDK